MDLTGNKITEMVHRVIKDYNMFLNVFYNIINIILGLLSFD